MYRYYVKEPSMSGIEEEYKTCLNCKSIKPSSNFHKQGTKKPRRADCDECRRKVVKKYHEQNKDVHQVRQNKET